LSDFTPTLQAALSPQYTLERELSGGGMSRVWVATDVALGRKVVVKVLPPELSAGVNHERFRREIQIAAQLSHPHIVPLLSAGEEGTIIWYTMPFIAGVSVREAIARGDRFSVRDVVRTMHEVAEGLDYAHGLGVIHRDIKPGNVLLMGSHALVTDFGVSKAISASMPHSGYTSAGMAIGTPAYMAPEQIAADPAADHRMDLYALGLLGYEMLTGVVPFKEKSPQQTMAAQLTREPEPVEAKRNDVPPALALLIRKLLNKAPDDRPARAADVVTALDEIGLSSGPSAAHGAISRPSRWRLAAVATAAVAVIATSWALGQKIGAEQGVGAMRDSLALAESLQAVAPAAALLTREDSMAIAQAVSTKLAERPAPARPRRQDTLALIAFTDSVRQVFQTAMMDSLLLLQRRITAEVPGAATFVGSAEAAAVAREMAAVRIADVRLAPAGRGPRRVVVAPPRPSRNRSDLDAIGTLLADSLRSAFDAHPRYVAVPADSVAAALRTSRTVNAIQEALAADVIVSISLIPARDSVVRLVQIRDLSAPGAFSMRVASSTVAADSPGSGLETLVPDAIRSLLEMELGARSWRQQREPTAPTSPTPAAPRRPPLERP
jgi:serine/threonine-protein kinase